MAGDPDLGFGVLVTGGAGGDGTLGGGKGGGVKKLDGEHPLGTDAVRGGARRGQRRRGDRLGRGRRRAARSRASRRSKDVNSTINAILGGNGGASASGAGGAGGAVKKIDTVGFIGLPASETRIPRRVRRTESPRPPSRALLRRAAACPRASLPDAARTARPTAAVHDVVARQIAAIGAVVDENGMFGVAAAVNNVNADLIGYDDQPRRHFRFDTRPGVSPSTARPMDGFMLAASVSGITTVSDARRRRGSPSGLSGGPSADGSETCRR